MYEILTEPLHVYSFIQHLKFFVFMHGGNYLQIKGRCITYFKESRLILHLCPVRTGYHHLMIFIYLDIRTILVACNLLIE